jgi:hypothetical protein
MSDITRHSHEADGAAGAKGSATLAMFLWVVVTLALVYGLYNTFIKVVDLFTG